MALEIKGFVCNHPVERVKSVWSHTLNGRFGSKADTQFSSKSRLFLQITILIYTFHTTLMMTC